MTAYFDRHKSDITDARIAADAMRIYQIDRKLVTDIAQDVELKFDDSERNFPDELKMKVYRIIWKYSFFVNEDRDVIPGMTEWSMIYRMNEELHDVYHERARMGHPFRDEVGLSILHFLDNFKDTCREHGSN